MKIDRELNFDLQRKEKIKKATRMMGAIRRSFKFLNVDTFKLLYKSMVRCHLESAVCVWRPYKVRDITQKCTASCYQDGTGDEKPNIRGKVEEAATINTAISETAWRYDTNVQDGE